MTLLQSLIIAILQGATELFPVSSLGHAVILPGLLGWSLDQHSPDFLPFLVVLHLGTAAALLLYFWRDWFGFACAVIGKGDAETIQRERRIFWLICAATLPAIILGFVFEHKLRDIFGAPMMAAFFLIINGFILFFGERVKHSGSKQLEQISFKTAFIIGACQALALIPGISRSGATMVGGVVAGLTHKDAARFSFLLATPIIAGAGVLEVPKMLKAHDQISFDPTIVIIAGIAAGITAYITTVILMRYFKNSETGGEPQALKPFAFYCWVVGLIALFMLR